MGVAHLPPLNWYTFGPQRVTHRSTLVIHRVLTGSISRVNLNAGTDLSCTDGTRVRVGAPQSLDSCSYTPDIKRYSLSSDPT